jgi:hypothetical protein
MKRLLLLPPVLLALTLTACADPPSGPSDTALTPTAPSFAVTENMWGDAPWNWFNPCGPTPEEVLLQGRIHIVFKQKGDKFEVRINSDGLKGVGQTTGNEYVFQAGEHTSIVPSNSLPYTGTVDARYRLMSRGSADNLFMVVHFVYTTPPFEFTEFTTTTECKG